MNPILFNIGPLKICTYGLMLAIAFITSSALIIYNAKKEGISTEKLTDLSFFIIISGIIGARIHFIFINLPDYLENPIKIFMIWEGGLVIYGGIAAAIIVGTLLIKRYNLPFWKTLDIIAPALILAQAIGRIGCLFAGCCYGCQTDLPWGIIFRNPNSLSPLGVSLHPTQIYHSVSNFFIFLILFYILRKRKGFDGQVFSLYLCLYPIGRFFVEFYRGDPSIRLTNHINLAQGISIIIFIIGVFLYFQRRSVSQLSSEDKS